MSTSVDVSIVIPVYRSSATLLPLYQRLETTFTSLSTSFEVIFVDDYSPDNSWAALLDLKKKYPNTIRIIRLSRNYGQHNATFCGFRHCKGNLIITIDDDLQIPPEEIPKLLQTYQQTKADVVYGFFPEKKHTFLKRLGSKILAKLAQWLANGQGQGSSFRLLTAELLQSLTKHYSSFIYIDELLLWYTQNIAFVEVKHLARQQGSSGYSYLKLFHLFGSLTLLHSSIPLRILTYLGLLASSLSFVIGIYYVLIWIFFDVPVQGFTAIIVSLFFISSLVLFALGVIGEFLRRIYTTLNNQPQYTIQQSL